MNTPNLGWLYYRDLYNVQREETVEIEKQKKKFNFSFDFLKQNSGTDEGKERKADALKKNAVVLKQRGLQLFDKKLSEYNPETFFRSKETINSFELTTTYPGLLCGVGYNHGISSESDFKVGFYFDHTTGLPVIPGSSVKGILRSAFPGYIRMDDNKKPSKEEMEERYKFFMWLIEETDKKTGANISKLSNKEIDTLEAFIFEGKDKSGEQISYYQRDRFFDAYPVRSLEHDGCFLKNDYITPHINRDKPEMSPFTNPNPIQFLKVLPKVQFLFQFKLVEGGGLDRKQKELLFKEILCYMGAGAKTNVGYGQFEEGFEEGPIVQKAEKKKEVSPYNGRIRQGEKFEAIVVDQAGKKVKAIIHEDEAILEMSGNCPENGAVVLVKINSVNRNNEILQVGFLRQLNP